MSSWSRSVVYSGIHDYLVDEKTRREEDDHQGQIELQRRHRQQADPQGQRREVDMCDQEGRPRPN